MAGARSPPKAENATSPLKTGLALGARRSLALSSETLGRQRIVEHLPQ